MFFWVTKNFKSYSPDFTINRQYETDVTIPFPMLGYDNTTTVVVRDILNNANVGTFTGK